MQVSKLGSELCLNFMGRSVTRDAVTTCEVKSLEKSPAESLNSHVLVIHCGDLIATGVLRITTSMKDNRCSEPPGRRKVLTSAS